MQKLFTVMTAVMLILAACTGNNDKFTKTEVNGITEYSNPDSPSDPSAKLDLKKLFTITNETLTDTSAYLKRPISIAVDSKENIYVLDLLSMSIKKFSSEGEFIKSIGRSGKGPGELFYPSTMLIDDDTLKVISSASRKMSKFTLDGDFIEDMMIDQMQIQNPKVSADGKNLVSYIVKPIMKEGQQPDISFSLSIIDIDSIKEAYEINNRIIQMQDMMAGKVDINDLAIPFAAGNEYVYVSENSDSHYKIFGYDYTGEKKFDIRKRYKRIRYEEQEKENYKEELKKMMNGPGSAEMKVGNFKKAVSNLHIDKYGRLLVLPNIDRNLDPDGVYIDIFKDGKFLNRVDYPVPDKKNSGVLALLSTMEFFLGEKLYVINLEELTIDVYDY